MSSMPLMHPARARRTRLIAARDVTVEWEDIYRQLVLCDFPTETRGGFQTAFYRPQAVTRMAAVLAGTGHIEADPARRTYDTAIVIFEIIHGGFESSRGQRMIRLLKALHERPDILQGDLTYVLCSLMVVPSRFIDRMGWRQMLDVERVATWRFWSELGRRIGVGDLPRSYEDASARFDQYEAENLAVSVEGMRLTQMIIDTFASWSPRVLRPYLPEITSCLIDDRRFSDALGLPPARRMIVATMSALYRLRRLRERLTPPDTGPNFMPGQSVGAVYPNGYSLDEIGPHAVPRPSE